jgi:putative endonuclease
MSFWVYILRCKGDSYYTGHTDNLENRIAQHQTGNIDGYTAARLPVELVWSQIFTTREEALSAEMQIKGWSRKKKEAMMRADWPQVNRLSRGKHRHERVVQSTSPFALSVGGIFAEVEGRKLKSPTRLGAPPALHASTLDAARPTLSTNGLVVSPTTSVSTSALPAHALV